MSYIEGIARNQMILFPEAIDDYIEEDNPVQFIETSYVNMKVCFQRLVLSMWLRGAAPRGQ